MPEGNPLPLFSYRATEFSPLAAEGNVLDREHPSPFPDTERRLCGELGHFPSSFNNSPVFFRPLREKTPGRFSFGGRCFCYRSISPFFPPPRSDAVDAPLDAVDVFSGSHRRFLPSDPPISFESAICSGMPPDGRRTRGSPPLTFSSDTTRFSPFFVWIPLRSRKPVGLFSSRGRRFFRLGIDLFFFSFRGGSFGSWRGFFFPPPCSPRLSLENGVFFPSIGAG